MVSILDLSQMVIRDHGMGQFGSHITPFLLLQKKNYRKDEENAV